MRAQNQQKINRDLDTNAQSKNIVNNFQGHNRTPDYQQQRKNFTSYPTVHQNNQYTSICPKCGQRWSHSRCQPCPAKIKKVSNCVITGHFIKKFCKPKKPHTQSSQPQQVNVNKLTQPPLKR